MNTTSNANETGALPGPIAEGWSLKSSVFGLDPCPITSLALAATYTVAAAVLGLCLAGVW